MNHGLIKRIMNLILKRLENTMVKYIVLKFQNLMYFTLEKPNVLLLFGRVTVVDTVDFLAVKWCQKHC